MPKILFVEDDRRIRIEVMASLTDAGLDVEVATDLRGAREMLQRCFDLALLDLGLPDGDGVELCRELRQQGSGLPILMLTARDEPTQRVIGLEAGADDYVVKPFHTAELIARVRGLLRRSGRQVGDGVVRLGPLWVDTVRRAAGNGNRELQLRRREFDLLVFLLRNPGRPWSRPQLLESVWGRSDDDTRTVDIHVRRLRAQIEADPSRPRRLVTDFGIGYRMTEAAS